MVQRQGVAGGGGVAAAGGARCPVPTASRAFRIESRLGAGGGGELGYLLRIRSGLAAKGHIWLAVWLPCTGSHSPTGLSVYRATHSAI
jgi:hypothetical protein